MIAGPKPAPSRSIARSPRPSPRLAGAHNQTSIARDAGRDTYVMNTQSTTASAINGKKLYKVLSHDGASQNGSEMKWSLPEGDAPGTWHEVDGDVRLCQWGLHLTTSPLDWMGKDVREAEKRSRIFECEGEGFQLNTYGEIAFHAGDDKCVAKRVRLLREVVGAELEALGVYVLSSGTHEIKPADGQSALVYASGTASVYASDTASVYASDTASVTASGTASVRAYDTASVRAFGKASVYASGTASVYASDTASVYASDTASVTASGTASVRAYDTASVRAFGKASVYASGKASVYASDTASVYASDTASVTASGTASVRAYDTASVRASDTASVYASGKASVTASGTASVTASGTASVRAFGQCTTVVHYCPYKYNEGVNVELHDDSSAIDYRSSKPKFHTRKSWGVKAVTA